MMRSTYTTTRLPGFICLNDTNEGSSVTNDAENVIEDLLRAGYDLEHNRVLYCDSQGVWDELVVRSGKFAGFHVLDADDLDAAIMIATAKPPRTATPPP